MNTIKSNIIRAAAFLIFALTLVSCDDYLNIEPVGKIIPKTVDDYRQFITTAYALPKNHKYLSAYRGDEIKLLPNKSGVEQYIDIYTWTDSGRRPETVDFSYQNLYSTIFYTNEIINNKDKIEGNKVLIDQLVGEAYALRALQYFDLVNLYGNQYDAQTASSDKGVPIVIEYNSEGEYPRASVQEVYDLILRDINNAESLITTEKQPIGLNYRFSKVALYTFKSMVYLNQKDWQNAKANAEKALSLQSTLQDLNTKNNLMPSEYNSEESILALHQVSSFDISFNSEVSQNLLNAFEDGDRRKAIYFNNKTFRKNANNKYKCTFRVSDLYLILAEVENELGNIDESRKMLIKLVEKRYDEEQNMSIQNQVNNANVTQLGDLIMLQRKLEFVLEGKRWFDLRRMGQPQLTKVYENQQYKLQKNDIRYVLPFPINAIINNPLLKE